MTLSSEERTKRLSRCCNTCGKCMNSLDRRQVVCSFECGHKGRRRQTIKLNCDTCGKECVKYADHLEKYKSVACSKRCQLMLATAISIPKVKATSAARKRQRTDERNAAGTPKKEWYRKRSKERAEKNEWWRICCAMSAKTSTYYKAMEGWKRRCISAASCVNRRELKRVFKQHKEAAQTWEEAIQKAMTDRYSAQKTEMTVWMRKCSSVAANLKLRKPKQTQKR